MNKQVIGLILMGVGAGAFIYELFFKEEKKDAKNSGNSDGGGSARKQNTAIDSNSRGDRIVVNNIYGRPKRKTAAELDGVKPKPKEGKKKDDKQSTGSAQVNQD